MNETTQKIEDVNNDKEKSQSLSPYCQVNCKICNSGHADIVREKVQAGERYADIVSYLFKEFNFSISPSGITRHWSNYKKALVENGRQREIARFNNESDELVRHQKQVTLIADSMFDLIADQIEAGTLPVSVADYTSLLKIRHGVLTGDSGAMDDLVGIFQQATDKYGVNLQQGVLFKKNKD
jgi:hypothetical protein